MTVHRSWTLDRLVEEYTQHQRRTRGLRPRTLCGRARLVRMLVRAALGEDPVEPSRLCQGSLRSAEYDQLVILRGMTSGAL